MACATTALCDVNAASGCDPPVCAVGQQQCKGSNLQICNAGRTAYMPGTDCGVAGCNALTNTCNTVVCTANAFTCSGQTLSQCNATGTASAPVATCTASQTCDATMKQCDDCVAGQFNCQGNILQSCVAGKWGNNTDCMTNVCDAANGTCDVVPDQ
jgi:hypothetical protein